MAGNSGQLAILEQIELDLTESVDAILREARMCRPEAASNLLIAAEHLNFAILEVRNRIASLR